MTRDINVDRRKVKQIIDHDAVAQTEEQVKTYSQSARSCCRLPVRPAAVSTFFTPSGRRCAPRRRAACPRCAAGRYKRGSMLPRSALLLGSKPWLFQTTKRL